MHKCVISVCEEQIEDARLACKPHWHLASQEGRDRVMIAWRAVFKSEQFRAATPEERKRRTSALRQAQDQFKNEVEEKLRARSAGARHDEV